MRAVVQRVKEASVSVDGKTINKIGQGLLVFLGIAKTDTEQDVDYLSKKVAGLRIFPEDDKEAAISVIDIKGEILLVSQFTLYGDMRKGKRPSFGEAAPPDVAKRLFDKFADILANSVAVKTGVFQAMMDISLVNDGPYTILIDSKKTF